MDVCPSPNSHSQCVGAQPAGPVDWSVNCTVSGAVPLRGAPLKLATGVPGRVASVS